MHDKSFQTFKAFFFFPLLWQSVGLLSAKNLTDATLNFIHRNPFLPKKITNLKLQKSISLSAALVLERKMDTKHGCRPLRAFLY